MSQLKNISEGDIVFMSSKTEGEIKSYFVITGKDGLALYELVVGGYSYPLIENNIRLFEEGYIIDVCKEEDSDYWKTFVQVIIPHTKKLIVRSNNNEIHS
jgi:hypothetical protein